MDKSHPLSIPMIIRSLDVKRGSFRPWEGNEVLGPEVPYLSAIRALIYLANNTWFDIIFTISVLACVFPFQTS